VTRWATRRGVHVDRAGCAWLIRRFIDPVPEFLFVSEPPDVSADATPFDMRGVELGHHAGHCSFETLLAHFGLADPALEAVGQLIHEADLADDRYDAPAAPGLDLIIRGLSLVCADDDETLHHTDRIFDGVYESLRRSLLTGRPPA
jgi:hypothetical protein